MSEDARRNLKPDPIADPDEPNESVDADERGQGDVNDQAGGVEPPD